MTWNFSTFGNFLESSMHIKMGKGGQNRSKNRSKNWIQRKSWATISKCNRYFVKWTKNSVLMVALDLKRKLTARESCSNASAVNCIFKFLKNPPIAAPHLKSEIFCGYPLPPYLLFTHFKRHASPKLQSKFNCIKNSYLKYATCARGLQCRGGGSQTENIFPIKLFGLQIKKMI